MTAHRIAALGAERASLALRTVEPLLRPIETEYFYDRDFVTAKASALASLLSGGTRVGLRDLNIPDAPNAISATVAAAVPQPFLFLKVDWLGDGTDVSYFSELDRANSRHNLQGKILQVGDFSRGYGASRNLQRMSGVTLRLEDFDRAIATRVRPQLVGGIQKTAKYNTARFYFSVGAPQLTEDYYAPVTCPFKVQRATVDETSVEFSLIDASDDVLLAVIQPPTVGAMISSKAFPSQGTRQNNMSATILYDWVAKGLDTLAYQQHFEALNDGNLNVTDDVTITPTKANFVPLPFNAWVKSPFAWARGSNGTYATKTVDGTAGNPLGVVVLGASKLNGWIQPHWWGDCQNAAATKVRNEPLIYVKPREHDPLRKLLGYGEPGTWQPNGHTGIGAYIDVHQVFNSSPSKLNELWYVAVLYVYSNVSVNADNGSNWAARVAMKRLGLAASRGEVYVDWNGNSASTAWQGNEKPVAAQVIGYFAQYHSFTPGTTQERLSLAIRGENRIIENYDDAATGDGISGQMVGGAILEPKAGSAIVDEICASCFLDQAYNAAGRLELRPAGVTGRDRGLGIPRGPQLTDNDIIDGTWKEEAPRGDDRWGFGNLFHLSGVQEVAKAGGWNGDFGPSTFSGTPPAGQTVERTIDISWQRQDPLVLGGTAFDEEAYQARWVLPYQVERQTVAFDVHFSAASGLELGEYVYITYYAGSNSDGTKGWIRKLCRIEGLDVRWEQQQVGVSAVVFQYQYQQQILLDDENRWTLFQPLNLDTLTLTAGSPNVTFNPAAGTQDRVAASWVGCTMKVSPSFNPKPYPAPDYATYVPAAATVFSSKIQSITDQLHFVMANNAPANATVYAWRVKYTHITPPPAARFAALFATDPADASPWTKYLQLADLGTGAFSNGDPAQRFQGP